MEDDLKKIRKTSSLFKKLEWKPPTNLGDNLKKMEDNLKKMEVDLKINWKTTSTKQKMEDDLKENKKQPPNKLLMHFQARHKVDFQYARNNKYDPHTIGSI
jgi:hypothetical protein